MDIQELSKKSYDRVLAQKNLEEKQMGRLLLPFANGLWICDTNLITLLHTYKDDDSVVLLDSYKIPRRVNPNELLSLVKKRHQEVMNDWLIEYNKLSQIRTAKHVLG